MSDISPELIRSALAYVPASLPRDEWARVAMGIKSEFPDTVGLDLFDAWSATDGDRYDKKSVTATWRSVKSGGGVGIATVLKMAQDGGFVLPKADQAPAAPTPAELAERQRQQAVRRQQEEADRRASHEGAAAEAQALWDGNCKDVTDPDQAPYLKRKSVKPYGVRFTSPGTLVVPLRDAQGKLWNVQRIAASKPKNGAPEKWFVKGGRKSGLWHMLGEVSNTGNSRILICEGYGTAASLHEATGYPVAVAFDAGNLQHVARALRNAYPAALLAMCGDDDRETEVQTGTNPGRVKATAAAQAVHGLTVFPEGLPDGGSDWNDLHQHVGGAAGLDAVRLQVQAAIDAHLAEQQARQSTQEAKPAKVRSKAEAPVANGASGPPVPPGESAGAAGASFDRFYVDESGLWFVPPTDDGGSSTPRRVCGPLWVTGLARVVDDNYPGRLTTTILAGQ